LLVLGPVILVGVVAALVTIGAHQGNSAFVYGQAHPSKIDPGQLETILAQTREPIPGGDGSKVTSARCLPGANGPKLNPWHCVLRYRSGDSIRYRIVVQPSGQFNGADRSGTRVIHGCCLLGGSAQSS
jgi:hypothetical protein